MQATATPPTLASAKKVLDEFRPDFKALGADAVATDEGVVLSFTDTRSAYFAPSTLRDSIDGVRLLYSGPNDVGGLIRLSDCSRFLGAHPDVIGARPAYTQPSDAAKSFVVLVDEANPAAADRLRRLIAPSVSETVFRDAPGLGGGVTTTTYPTVVLTQPRP